VDFTISSAFTWVALGLLIGIGAALLVPGHDPSGRVGTLFVAVIGSTAGGLIARALKVGSDTNSPAGWMLAVIGAALAVATFHGTAGVRGPV
jgi:uncharacterized membrane protein YeaQ/YmgE (transglycosylase-associated protein family)